MVKGRASVTDFGAVADGITDSRAAFQAALDSGADEVLIPAGIYSVSGTLFVRSDTKITAAFGARICLRPAERLRREDFLLSTSPDTEYSENIVISGGVWDGGNSLPECALGEPKDSNGYTGAVINFDGVRGLKLSDMTVANATAFSIRLCRTEDFTVEKISFLNATAGEDRDGLHFGGECRRGRVRGIRDLSNAKSKGELIALNADDFPDRAASRGMASGAIEDITFEDISAEDCYTAVRLLSVFHPIRRISFKDLQVGYRKHAINMDAGRYSETPIFKGEDYPDGIGCIENVSFTNLVARYTTPFRRDEKGYHIYKKFAVGVRLETLCDGLSFRNCHFVGLEDFPPVLALCADNMPGTVFVRKTRRYTLGHGENITLGNFKNLRIIRSKGKEIKNG